MDKNVIEGILLQIRFEGSVQLIKNFIQRLNFNMQPLRLPFMEPIR